MSPPARSSTYEFVMTVPMLELGASAEGACKCGRRKVENITEANNDETSHDTVDEVSMDEDTTSDSDNSTTKYCATKGRRCRLCAEVKSLEDDLLMYDLVRSLSNVSTEFRNELASVLWKDTELVINLVGYLYDCGDFYDEVREFLEERPAVADRIKSIFLRIDVNEEFEIYSYEELELMCHSLSKLTNLKTLYVDIWTRRRSDLENLEDRAFESGNFPHFKCWSLIDKKVKRKLRVDDVQAWVWNENYEESCKHLCEQYGPIFMKMMTPGSDSETITKLTEEDLYISAPRVRRTCVCKQISRT